MAYIPRGGGVEAFYTVVLFFTGRWAYNITGIYYASKHCKKLNSFSIKATGGLYPEGGGGGSFLYSCIVFYR